MFIDENKYGYHDYDDDWDEEEDDLEEEDGLDVESDDSLLNLLAENREYLKKGDYRLLYGIMEKCGYKPEEDEEPFYSSAQMKSLPHPVKELLTFIQIE